MYVEWTLDFIHPVWSARSNLTRDSCANASEWPKTGNATPDFAE